MGKPIKTVEEKFKTRLDNLLKKDFVSSKGNLVFYKEKKILSFNKQKVSYGTLRIAPAKKEEFYEDEYKVDIILNHENLSIIGGNFIKVPYGIKIIYKLINNNVKSIKKFVIGSNSDKIVNGVIHITKKLYDTIVAINNEETRDKNQRIKNRTNPFLVNNLNIKKLDKGEYERDYQLLLREIVSSKKISSKDVVTLSKELDPGDDSQVVITQQIEKQTEWLLKKIRDIIDEPKLTKSRSQDLGKQIFNYPKISISGPESLMEKILTDYGKNIIFGVPALLNTDKYVISDAPKVQFDIILINNLSDVEIVELKRPDIEVLDYDDNRNKFYPSKDLSIAIGQAERYITSINKDNDARFKIKGKKIKDYIEGEFGGAIELSITRPSALIIIGTIDRISKKYELLDSKIRGKITKIKYNRNSEQAYRELKNTHKNIMISTYTELIEGAELRFKN